MGLSDAQRVAPVGPVADVELRLHDGRCGEQLGQLWRRAKWHSCWGLGRPDDGQWKLRGTVSLQTHVHGAAGHRDQPRVRYATILM